MPSQHNENDTLELKNMLSAALWNSAVSFSLTHLAWGNMPMQRVKNLHVEKSMPFTQSKVSQVSLPHTCYRSQGCKADALGKVGVRTRKNGHKLKDKEIFFNVSMIKDVVDCPSLQLFKSCLDFALDNLHLMARLEQGVGPDD